jgi:hypothetical protein
MLRVALVSGLLALGFAPVASADVLLPPRGKVYTGLSGERSVGSFAAQVGKRPSVFGFFTQWGGLADLPYEAADRAGARPMLHISTQDGYGTRERITPRGLARGGGDGYLARLNRRLSAYGKHVYVRLLAEMNQTNNGYCAYNRDGSSRGPSHSTRVFRQAWRRAALVLRGGPVDPINAQLREARAAAAEDRGHVASAPAALAAVGAADRGDAEHPRQSRAGVLARLAIRRLGGHRLLLALPQLPRTRGVLRRLPAQAVRVRRVGDVGA